MHVEIDGVVHRISFFHGVGLFDFDYRDPVTGESERVQDTREYCECYITTGMGEDKVKVCEGQAICHPNDTYCKEQGRKIALTNALMHFEDRVIRKKFWDAYLGRKKKPEDIQVVPAGI